LRLRVRAPVSSSERGDEAWRATEVRVVSTILRGWADRVDDREATTQSCARGDARPAVNPRC
jgi:hypothetical protein